MLKEKILKRWKTMCVAFVVLGSLQTLGVWTVDGIKEANADD